MNSLEWGGKIKYVSSFKKCIILFIYWRGGNMQVPGHACEVRGQSAWVISLSTTWVLGIDIRSLGLTANAFSSWAISSDPKFMNYFYSLCVRASICYDTSEEVWGQLRRVGPPLTPLHGFWGLKLKSSGFASLSTELPSAYKTSLDLNTGTFSEI